MVERARTACSHYLLPLPSGAKLLLVIFGKQLAAGAAGRSAASAENGFSKQAASFRRIAALSLPNPSGASAPASATTAACLRRSCHALMVVVARREPAIVKLSRSNR
jgi:hypothetical protein